MKRKIVIVQEPNKRIKFTYPRKFLRNSLEFSFMNQKETWKNLNLKDNKYLNKSTFGKLLPLENDLFKFKNILEIGVSLLPGQISNIFSYEYFNNSRAFFVAPTLKSIKELILSGENYLHECIYNLPIKFFMDIDNPIQPQHFQLERKIILKKIERIKAIYDKKLLEICECDGIKNKWLLKEASYSKKISFHLVANHTCTYYCQIRNKMLEVPILFKNCEHVNFMTRKIKKQTKYGFIDDGIGNGKSLRMYFCAYKNDKSRIFRCNNNEPVFNFDHLKNSLLQIRPELVENFYQVDLFGDRVEEKEDDDDVISEAEMLRSILPRSSLTTFGANPNITSNLNAVHRRRRNIPKHRLPNKYDPLGKDVVDEVIQFLVSKRMIKGFNFKHLSKYKNKISIYRILKQNESPFALFIEIFFMNCLMQDFPHSHTTGRTVIVNGQDKRIGLMCGSPKRSKHTKTGFFLFFRETNDGVRKRALTLLEKTKDE